MGGEATGSVAMGRLRLAVSFCRCVISLPGVVGLETLLQLPTLLQCLDNAVNASCGRMCRMAPCQDLLLSLAALRLSRWACKVVPAAASLTFLQLSSGVQASALHPPRSPWL